MSSSSGTIFAPYTIFHATIGYAIVCVGIVALISRLVIVCAKSEVTIGKWSRVHRIAGQGWLLSTYLMPITAIYIKPWYVVWDFVAFFIFSMYISMIAAYICIRIREVVRGERTKLILKILHGLLMFYSWAMLVGAGISFPFRAVDRAAGRI